MSEYSQKTTTLKFSTDCTIYEVSELHEKLSEAFKKAPVVKLDCSKIENIDPSFIQLLVVAQLEAKRIKSDLEILGDLEKINEFSKNMHCDLSVENFKNITTGGE